ncbi:MAG: omptin family outer membrane protease [Treponema sp.]|nr:omptin family outer membrane protease [Treponema sp.]
MKKIFFSLILLFSTLSLGAHIFDFEVSVEPVYSLQNGTLYEYVYVHDYTSDSTVKLSELDWNLNNLSYVGGRASLDWEYFSLIAEITACLSKNSGTMEDYDWLDYTSSGSYYYYNDPSMCTNKSISENYLDSSTFMKIMMQGNIPVIWDFFVKPYIGVEYHTIKFSARNGYGWYGDTQHVPYTDANATYYASGTLGSIDYDRNTLSTYFGFSAGYSFFDRLSLSAYASFCPYTYVESLDFHHNLNSETTGNFYNDIMYGFFKEWRFGAYVEYKILDSLFVDTSLDFVFLNELSGITYKDTSKNMKNKTLAVTTSACAAKYWDLKLGIKWTF